MEGLRIVFGPFSSDLFSKSDASGSIKLVLTKLHFSDVLTPLENDQGSMDEGEMEGLFSICALYFYLPLHSRPLSHFIFDESPRYTFSETEELAAFD